MKKTIYFQTNYNNKLACDCFIHVDEAPRAGIPESKLEETIIEIRTNDNSHPPVETKLIDLLRLPLHDISSTMTLPSHGMESFEFVDFKFKENPKLNTSSPMAVYYYKKIHP